MGDPIVFVCLVGTILFGCIAIYFNVKTILLRQNERKRGR